MPLDSTMSDAMLGTFRNMAKEIKDKEYVGEDVDKMNEVLARMEELTQIHSDMNDFSGAMMQENLYMKFSDHYGRALGAGMSGQYQLKGEGYGPEQDKQLLDQSLNAYRDAIKRLEQAKKESVQTHGEKKSGVFFKESLLIKPIQDVIDLGESGLTYGTFLRKMIELGMDKAMEGSVVMKDSLIYLRDMMEAIKASPYEGMKCEDHILNFEHLVSITKFNVPPTLKFNLANEASDIPHDINAKRWYAIKNYWETIISHLSDWAIAHCSFAHTLDPWAMAKNPTASVRETVECEPGEIAIFLNIMQRNFDVDFNGIFEHETFAWEVEHHKLWYSQEYITFLKNEAYPHCQPGKKMPADLITKMEGIYKGKKLSNPNLHLVVEKSIEVHDNYFGKGSYAAEHGLPDKVPSNAAAWNLATFS